MPIREICVQINPLMFRKQPKIDIQPTPKDLKIIKIGWLLVILNFILVFAFYFQLPETIPTHFNLQGEANDHSHKNNIWIIPLLNLATYFGMSLLITKMKPWNYNYPTKVTEKNAPKLYAMGIEMMVWLNFGIALMFLVISLEIILKTIKTVNFSIGWSFMHLIAFLTLFPFWYIYKMLKLPKQ